MIDYATWCAIRQLLGDGAAQKLMPAQLAASLELDIKTVRRWIARPYTPRQGSARPSLLDPFKGSIARWLEQYPLSAQQVFQRLNEAGFQGGW